MFSRIPSVSRYCILGGCSSSSSIVNTIPRTAPMIPITTAIIAKQVYRRKRLLRYKGGFASGSYSTAAGKYKSAPSSSSTANATAKSASFDPPYSPYSIVSFPAVLVVLLTLSAVPSLIFMSNIASTCCKRCGASSILCDT